ncbi:MAG TPA: HDOD domain-containing protein [Tepidisphaeraceae bacterium]|jgi:HD-like signal output (HDOD) protein|nr:HDOD domain-containing protein [Tepidisphaeraceae bacterium]
MATATAPATTPVSEPPSTAVLEMIKKVSSIATLPEITAKIIATVEDPKSTPATLHKIVSHDPALVTRILKVVNSAFYGLPGQIASIERAIVLLGLNAIKNIAVAASLGQLFRGVKLCEGFTAKDLWTHCIAVGITARYIAKQMKVPLADEAFLAGMIHDVGLLVSLQVMPEKLRNVCESAKAPASVFCDLEREQMGMDHQQLGAALCEQWKFPRSCQRVAGYHHRPFTLSDNNRHLVSIVHVADTLVATGNYGFNLTAVNQKLDEEALEGVGIDAMLIELARKSLPDLLSNSAGVFA